MLTFLHIENIAVIESADIEFYPGLNVLTGETGAGKSIVIDAINAVLGHRASKELIRTGALSAIVTASFDIAPAGWLSENGIEPDEDGGITLFRKITTDGKNLCRINGLPVTVSQLRELGGRLIDIHGQNDGQRLLDESYHREYLDSFLQIDDVLEDYRSAYGEYIETLHAVNELDMDERERERIIENLRAQIGELEGAGLRVGEEDELQERCEILKNAGKLTNAVERAFLDLCGDDDSDGALALISDAERAASALASMGGEGERLLSAMSELRFAAEDVAEQLRDLKRTLDFSPEEYDLIETRLDQLMRLKRRYGGSEEEMLQHLEKCRDELDRIEYSTDRLDKLQKTLDEKAKRTMVSALRLSKLRRDGAKELEKRIVSELKELSMPGVRFNIEFKQRSGDPSFDSNGMDEVRFLMSANAGEDLGRISKIASGGELSRIMLAMKNVLAESEDIGTLVFDEIDAGVSGIAATRVGEKLANVAEVKQVLCVTHLSQIAAQADMHFSIEKSERGGRAFTEVIRLDREGRRYELSRLTGGDTVTETTLKAAEELLNSAEKYKKGRLR